jgi:hypothetical protein
MIDPFPDHASNNQVRVSQPSAARVRKVIGRCECELPPACAQIRFSIAANRGCDGAAKHAVPGRLNVQRWSFSRTRITTPPQRSAGSCW